MSIITRFAPSPTGYLHIGGARTALFNWLYARHTGGKYLLRIEDTDQKRSTPEAIDAILDGLDWLNLTPDEEPIYQSARRKRHADVVKILLDNGNAYPCYCTPEELKTMREKAMTQKKPVRYDGTWRDKDPTEAPPDIEPVIRFRASISGETTIEDAVQGKITIANQELDDLIMLRADGSPTYMLSAVVDDHDMEISHVIRGDDHLTNAFRQTQIFMALGWSIPKYAHIPLIHGSDGAKMSKRDGALGIDAYREKGYLPSALLNYLSRLGWSHGDDEIFSLIDAIKWFELEDINKSAARFDFSKLSNLNGKYIAGAKIETLTQLIRPLLEERLTNPLNGKILKRLEAGLHSLKVRANTIQELADMSLFYCAERPIDYDSSALKLLTPKAQQTLAQLNLTLRNLTPWKEETIEVAIKKHAIEHEERLKDIAQPLRAALTGTNVSPGIFEVAANLGQKETLGRINDVSKGSNAL
ncbi:MAG: glutamate--tRNA ligase [Pseudomonadota bacterium]|nr:glutamate--tRNA ligase [Pseudomonadota bacterium]